MNRFDKKIIAEYVASAMARARFCRANGMCELTRENVAIARRWSRRFGERRVAA